MNLALNLYRLLTSHYEHEKTLATYNRNTIFDIGMHGAPCSCSSTGSRRSQRYTMEDFTRTVVDYGTAENDERRKRFKRSSVANCWFGRKLLHFEANKEFIRNFD